MEDEEVPPHAVRLRWVFPSGFVPGLAMVSQNPKYRAVCPVVVFGFFLRVDVPFPAEEGRTTQRCQVALEILPALSL